MTKVTQLESAKAPRDLRQQFRDEITGAGLSVTDAAREIGRSHATISRWLRGTYTGDVPKVEALVARWLETRAEVSTRSLANAGLDRHAETGASAEIMSALTYAQGAGDIVTIIGASGRGKTWTAERYCASKSGAFYLSVSGAVFSLPGLLSKVSAALGVDMPPRTPALEAETKIIERLRGRNFLLVVDEAHHLRDKLLDELRIIRDRAGCGLAIIGDESIKMALTRCDQVAGRVGLRVDLPMQPDGDVAEIATGPLGRRPRKAELKILVAAARGPGGLHALRRLLGRAWMMAHLAGRDVIEPADIVEAADEGVAAEDAAADEAAA